jgi:hypothetical protein
MAAPFGRLRTTPREVCPAPPGVRGGFRIVAKLRAMSLDGLRAWIGLVERKLAMRTRVFLVLVALAVGGAGAGIYLGLEAQSDRVDEGDLQTVQDELSGRIDALESRLSTLEASGATTVPEPSTEPAPELPGEESGESSENGSSKGPAGAE